MLSASTTVQYSDVWHVLISPCLLQRTDTFLPRLPRLPVESSTSATAMRAMHVLYCTIQTTLDMFLHCLTQCAVSIASDCRMSIRKPLMFDSTSHSCPSNREHVDHLSFFVQAHVSSWAWQISMCRAPNPTHSGEGDKSSADDALRS